MLLRILIKCYKKGIFFEILKYCCIYSSVFIFTSNFEVTANIFWITLFFLINIAWKQNLISNGICLLNIKKQFMSFCKDHFLELLLLVNTCRERALVWFILYWLYINKVQIKKKTKCKQTKYFTQVLTMSAIFVKPS